MLRKHLVLNQGATSDSYVDDDKTQSHPAPTGETLPF